MIGISLTVVMLKTYLNKFIEAKMPQLKRFSSITKCFFFLFVCLFSSPDIISDSNTACSVSEGSWSIGTMFLKWLVSGDLVTVMTLGAQLDSVDSFHDLANRDLNTTITAFAGTSGGDDNVRQHYFSDQIFGREQLTKRLKLLEMEKMNDKDVVAKMLHEVSVGKRYHLGFDLTLRYCLNNWFNGNYSQVLYISNDFNQFMPGFMMLFQGAVPELKSNLRLT